MLASEPFPAAGDATLSLELVRGILNPTYAAELPAVNCLFLTENLACNGDRIAEPAPSECVAEREMLQRRSPSNFSGCDEVNQPPVDACVYNARDPGCDGFARESARRQDGKTARRPEPSAIGREVILVLTDSPTHRLTDSV
jgi:hypothetical protein